jgi:hypothetical protein
MIQSLKSALAFIFWTVIGLSAKCLNRENLNSSVVLDPWSLPHFPKVAVLGRSESALALESYDDYDLTVLVNYSDSDLLGASFRKRVLSSQRIILLHNSMERSISPKIAKQMNLSAVAWLGFHPSTGTNRRRSTWRLNRLGRKVEYLPQHCAVSASSQGRSAGIGGVALASLISDEVHLFGIDFYRADYIPESEGKSVALRVGLDQQESRGPSAEKAFRKVASLRPEVSFVVHSYLDVGIKASNITSIMETRRPPRIEEGE